MAEILDFLIEFEIWFYIILGFISLIFFSRLFKALGNWREAAFGLEREIAQRKFRSSISILILIVVMIIAEFFFVTYSSSILPDQTNLATPTIDVLTSPSPTSEVLAELATPEVISATPTPEEDGCIPGQIDITSPGPATEVEDVVRLMGTVNIDNFGFYKYEYTEPGNPIWKTIAGNSEEKIDAQLGIWNTSQLVPGDYLLRLVVLDNENNEYPACVISVRVVSP